MSLPLPRRLAAQRRAGRRGRRRDRRLGRRRVNTSPDRGGVPARMRPRDVAAGGPWGRRDLRSRSCRARRRAARRVSERLWTPHRMAYITGDGGKPTGSARLPVLPDPDAGRRGRAGRRPRRARSTRVLNLYPYNPGHLMVRAVPARRRTTTTSTDDESAELMRVHAAGAARHARGRRRRTGSTSGSTRGGRRRRLADHLHQHVGAALGRRRQLHAGDRADQGDPAAAARDPAAARRGLAGCGAGSAGPAGPECSARSPARRATVARRRRTPWSVARPEPGRASPPRRSVTGSPAPSGCWSPSARSVADRRHRGDAVLRGSRSSSPGRLRAARPARRRAWPGPGAAARRSAPCSTPPATASPTARSSPRSPGGVVRRGRTGCSASLALICLVAGAADLLHQGARRGRRA